MSESQTPRTDAERRVRIFDHEVEDIVPTRLAMELQAELTATRAHLAESAAAHAELTERYKRTHDLWIASEEEKGNLENEYESLKSRLAELEGEKAKMVLDFAASIKHVVTSMLAHQRNSLQRNVRIAELTTENRKLREELEAYKKK